MDNTDRPERVQVRPRGIGPGYYVVLSRIVHLYFRELTFYEVG